MNCRRALAVFLVLLLLGLVALHEYLVRDLKAGIQDSLQEDSGYPVRVKSFHGFLPLGKVWAKGFEFRTKLGTQTSDSIQWSFPTASLDVRPLSLFSSLWLIDRFSAPGFGWEARLPTLKGELRGNLWLEGQSSSPAPENLPKETLWCERMEASIRDTQGTWNGIPLELPQKIDLTVEPFTLCNGAPVVPLRFGLEAKLPGDEGGAVFSAKGEQDQTQGRLVSDLRLVAVTRSDLLRIFRVVSAFDPYSQAFGELAQSWIREGSFSVRLNSVASAEKVTGKVSMTGDITLRMQGPKFGEALKSEKVEDQPIRPFLEAFERRTDTFQIGPISFSDKDLTDGDSKAWTQIMAGLVPELIKLAPEAAFETGAGLLKKFFKGNRDPSNPD